MNEKASKTESKKTWSPPALTVYGNVGELTQGSPNPTMKTLGNGDDILTQINNGISSL